MKTSNGRRIVVPTKTEIEWLKLLCKAHDCTMPELMESITSNVVSEEIGVNLCYQKHGCHPDELKNL